MPALANETELIRMRADLKAMVTALAWHGRMTNADYLDSLLRREVERRFGKLPGDARRRANREPKSVGK